MENITVNMNKMTKFLEDNNILYGGTYIRNTLQFESVLNQSKCYILFDILSSDMYHYQYSKIKLLRNDNNNQYLAIGLDSNRCPTMRLFSDTGNYSVNNTILNENNFIVDDNDLITKIVSPYIIKDDYISFDEFYNKPNKFQYIKNLFDVPDFSSDNLKCVKLYQAYETYDKIIVFSRSFGVIMKCILIKY